MAQGEREVLCTEPVLALEQTGGSTSGAKLIPYTASGLAAFQRAVLPWLDDLFTARPGIARGRMYWSISPVLRPRALTAAGIPIGLPSDAAYLGDTLAPILGSLLAVPPQVAHAGTLAAWKRQTQDALGAARDLTFVSVWSPTFLLELLRDLPGARTAPEALWPQLDTVSCWTSASSQGFATELATWLPHAQLQGKGLLATEGVVTIALHAARWPVLAVDSGFYEFVGEDGRAQLCDALIEGETYRVLLTTHSGLYRYELHDRVRMRGRLAATPLLEFIGRAGVVSDLCGEKLTEAFVLRCLADICGFALLAPSVEGTPHYVLFVDVDGPMQPEPQIETALCANPQYAYARALGQLGPVQIRRIQSPIARYQAHEAARGRRLGDLKPPVLSDKTGWEEVFS